MSETHYTQFDRWVARMRHNAAKKQLKHGSRVCDVGCGVDALFLESICPFTSVRVGLDYQDVTARIPDTRFCKTSILQKFPLADGLFDHVTLLAVIEHLRDPSIPFREAYRILVPGGSLILTWPSPLIDPLLDILMKVGIVSPKTEIDKHEQRIPVNRLQEMLRQIGFERFHHERFEFGLNNLLVAFKPQPGSVNSGPSTPPAQDIAVSGTQIN